MPQSFLSEYLDLVVENNQVIFTNDNVVGVGILFDMFSGIRADTFNRVTIRDNVVVGMSSRGIEVSAPMRDSTVSGNWVKGPSVAIRLVDKHFHLPDDPLKPPRPPTLMRTCVVGNRVSSAGSDRGVFDIDLGISGGLNVIADNALLRTVGKIRFDPRGNDVFRTFRIQAVEHPEEFFRPHEELGLIAPEEEG